MWDALREKKIGVRIMLGIIVGILGIGMLLYLVPQGTNDLSAADTVAQVGDQTITVVAMSDIRMSGALLTQVLSAPAETKRRTITVSDETASPMASTAHVRAETPTLETLASSTRPPLIARRRSPSAPPCAAPPMHDTTGAPSRRPGHWRWYRAQPVRARVLEASVGMNRWVLPTKRSGPAGVVSRAGPYDAS